MAFTKFFLSSYCMCGGDRITLSGDIKGLLLILCSRKGKAISIWPVLHTIFRLLDSTTNTNNNTYFLYPVFSPSKNPVTLRFAHICLQWSCNWLHILRVTVSYHSFVATEWSTTVDGLHSHYVTKQLSRLVSVHQ
jgi:hypothetical protein